MSRRVAYRTLSFRRLCENPSGQCARASCLGLPAIEDADRLTRLTSMGFFFFFFFVALRTGQVHEAIGCLWRFDKLLHSKRVLGQPI